MTCPVCNLRDCTWTAEGVCEGTMEPAALRARARRREAREEQVRWAIGKALFLFNLGTTIWCIHWVVQQATPW